MYYDDIERQCLNMKLKALDMAFSSKAFGSHIGGSFSAMELLATLYNFANISSGDDEQRDRIIISKGHCVLALYTALWQKGFISEDVLNTYETNGTVLNSHAHENKKYAIEFSGGSLGLGLSYATGVALGCKRKGLGSHVYVLVGDGELDEGICWESLMSMANFKLYNITVIVDRNKYQLDGPTTEVMDQYSLEDKFTAFGFDVQAIDGHSIPAIAEALNKNTERPKAIIADTIKAHGISFLENNKKSHQCTLSKKKYEQAVQEIKEAYHVGE
jgi:transketolase